MKLEGRVALVTGGGRGIGEAIALALAREGADVIVTARTDSEVASVAAQIEALGRRALAVAVDIGSREGAARLVEETERFAPRVDVLVNNAGVGGSQNPNPVAAFDDDFWDLSIAVNLTAPYLLTKAYLPGMVEGGWGRVINIASIAGKRGALNRSAYSATKHGLIGLTRSAALEVASNGVTVNAICPGPVRTIMFERLLGQMAEREGVSSKDMEARLNPLGRMLEPDEVAELAVYLASDEAASVTGQSLNIDGGIVSH